MTQVQTMTNEHLNIALSKLMGRTEATAAMVNYSMIARYCEDPAASLEVQTAACNERFYWYIQALSKVVGADGYWDMGALDYEGIALLLNASPRERAEAAYITLSSKQ